MGVQLGQLSLLTVAITASISAVTAILAVILTSALTRRREHEADWRKLKLAQYQEFVLALSGIVGGRATDEAQRRYSDAVNGLSLVASSTVLHAQQAFQKEISYINANRDDREHDRLLNCLFLAMRADIQPARAKEDLGISLWLLGVPPEIDGAQQ